MSVFTEFRRHQKHQLRRQRQRSRHHCRRRSTKELQAGGAGIECAPQDVVFSVLTDFPDFLCAHDSVRESQKLPVGAVRKKINGSAVYIRAKCCSNYLEVYTLWNVERST